MDSRAAALEELLLGDVSNPAESVLSSTLPDRLKFDAHTPADLPM